MAFADSRTGWNWPGLAATGAVQLALLLVAVLAFGISDQPEHVRPDTISVRFRPAMSASEAEPPAGKQPEPVEHETPPVQAVAKAKADRSIQATDRPSTVSPSATLGVDVRPVNADDGVIPIQPIPQPLHLDPVEKPDRVDQVAQYAALLRQKIMAWRPGGLADQGRVRLAFTVDRAGRLTGSHIETTSGNVRLDRTALRMLRRAAPFDPPPADASEAQLHFAISVNFN